MQSAKGNAAASMLHSHMQLNIGETDPALLQNNYTNYVLL